MEQLDYKFCGLVEEYRLEIAKKSWIELQLDVSLAWCTICWIHENVLISKKFWFIKWLIENDKIEKNKVFHFIDNSELEEDVLCNLAISDTPINDLISYLK